jgi:hypothetical protein
VKSSKNFFNPTKTTQIKPSCEDKHTTLCIKHHQLCHKFDFEFDWERRDWEEARHPEKLLTVRWTWKKTMYNNSNEN